MSFESGGIDVVSQEIFERNLSQNNIGTQGHAQ